MAWAMLEGLGYEYSGDVWCGRDKGHEGSHATTLEMSLDGFGVRQLLGRLAWDAEAANADV